MASPTPLPPEKRRRRNIPERGEWQDLPEITDPILPDLPEDEREWSDQTRSSWDLWRMDPATALYSPAEIAYALDTIRIYEEKGPNDEIRRRMDGLGLTPKGKRDLRYRVGDGLELDGSAAKQTRQMTRARSRRSRLAVVK